MSTFPSVMRKDLRAVAPRAIIAACAWLPILALPALTTGAQKLIVFFYFAIFTLGGIAGFFALARLFHEDPMAGSSGFLATRPISRTRLLAEKLLVAFAVLVVPGAIVRTIAFTAAAAAPTAPLVACLLLQQLVVVSALFAVLLLPALWTTSQSRMILTTIAFFVAMLLVQLIVARIFPPPPHDGLSGPDQAFQKVLLMQAAWVVGALVAAWCQARTRRHLWAGVLFLIAASFGFWLPRNWMPSQSPRPLADLPPSVALSIQEPARLHTDIRGDHVVQTMSLAYQEENLPPGILLTPRKITTTFRNSYGEQTLQRGTDWIDGSRNGRNRSIDLKKWLGLPLSKFDFSTPNSLQLAGAPADARTFEGIDLSSIRGTVTFDVEKPCIIATLAPRIGAEAVAPPYCIRIVQLSSSAESIQVRVTITWVAPPFLPRTNMPASLQTFRLLAKNTRSPLKSLLMEVGSSGSSIVGPLCISEISFETYRSGDQDFPTDMSQSMELQIIALETIGGTSLPFRVPAPKSAQ